MNEFVEWFEAMLEERVDKMAEAGQEPGWVETGAKALIADWRRLAAKTGEPPDQRPGPDRRGDDDGEVLEIA